MASISGMSSTLQGGAEIEQGQTVVVQRRMGDVRVNRFGPMNENGEHRWLNTGSKRIRTPRPAPPSCLVGNSTKKHACPSHVVRIESFPSSPCTPKPQVGVFTGRFSLTSTVLGLGKLVAAVKKSYMKGEIEF